MGPTTVDEREVAAKPKQKVEPASACLICMGTGSCNIRYIIMYDGPILMVLYVYKDRVNSSRLKRISCRFYFYLIKNTEPKLISIFRSLKICIYYKSTSRK